MFYTRLKEILLALPNKTAFLKKINISSSYLGFRYFLSGKQEKMGEKSLNAILDKLGYDLVIVPVKKTETGELDPANMEKIKDISEEFFTDLEKFIAEEVPEEENGRRYERIKIDPNAGPTALETALMDFDSTKITKKSKMENTSTEDKENTESDDFDIDIDPEDLF